MRKGYKRWLAIVMLVSTLISQAACGQEELPYQVGGSQGGAARTEADAAGNALTTGDGTKEIQILEKTSDDVYQAKDMVSSAGWYTLMEGKVTEEGVCVAAGKSLTYNAYSGGKQNKVNLVWKEMTGVWTVLQFCLGFDGSVYTYSYCKDEQAYYLCKFDSEKNFSHRTSLKDFTEENGDTWISTWEMEADTEGRVYLATDTTIRLYDADGAYYGNVAFDSADIIITDMEATSDGAVYLLYTKGMSRNSYFAKIDFAGKKIENIGKTIVLNGMAETADGILSVYDQEQLYEYDVAAGEMMPLFSWLDCNINGQEILEMGLAEDGRMVVLNGTMSNYGGQVTLIKRMTKEEAASIPEKQEIVIGMLGTAEKALAEAVVRFNKESDLYRIVIRNYSSGTDLDTARMTFYGEIVSGKGPDIFEVSGLDMDNLAEKGLFVNLYDFVEKSEALSKKDFFERLLELYTRDGELVAMPQAFSVRTYMGNKALLGDRKSWNLEEMLAFVQQYPEKDVTYSSNRLNMLNTCMSFNEAEFIDWETGECRFTSERFIHLLKLCNSYPEESMSSKGISSQMTAAVNGDVLLVDVTIGQLDRLQPFSRVFEAGYTCVGFPAAEGIGYECVPESVMAISALSGKQEGAWAFLEYFYQYRRAMSFDFPVLKSIFEVEAKERINRDDSFSSTLSYPDGATYEVQPPTWEEVDMIYELIDGMQLRKMTSLDVFFIIKEEVAAYFEGQKSAEEVAEIIQNRVQIYVDENR